MWELVLLIGSSWIIDNLIVGCGNNEAGVIRKNHNISAVNDDDLHACDVILRCERRPHSCVVPWVGLRLSLRVRLSRPIDGRTSASVRTALDLVLGDVPVHVSPAHWVVPDICIKIE